MSGIIDAEIPFLFHLREPVNRSGERLRRASIRVIWSVKGYLKAISDSLVSSREEFIPPRELMPLSLATLQFLNENSTSWISTLAPDET